MPSESLIDPATLDCGKVLFTREQIYKILPQQFEVSQLDGFILADHDQRIFAAYRDVKPDEWWCRGHMPQRAIFPGVLMVESAAQLSAFVQHLVQPSPGVMGFLGIEGVKFRDSVFPPARVILVGKVLEARPRRFQCAVQGFLDSRMVFEGVIIGARLKL